MPDKRQTSKQRRAARNRAQRDALAARRQNAGVATTRPASSSTSATTTSTASGAAGGGAARGRTRLGRAGRRPGDLALIVALGLALAAFVLLLNTDIPVDDRGEALPATFSGVAMEARAALTDGPVVDESENIVSYYGAGVVALMAVPLLVVAVVFVLSRRWEQRGRLLTFALLGLAGVVVLTGTFGFYYMPALIALAVASFQVRKLEMPTRPTQPRQGRGAGRRGAIDVDEVDDDVDIDDEPEAVPPAPSTRSRRSGSRSRRAAATAPADDEPAETYEDGDVYDPETGVKDAAPDVLEADVVDAEVVDEPTVPDEPVEDRPTNGRSRGGLRRRGRRSEPAPGGTVEADITPVVGPEAVQPEVTPPPTNGDAAPAADVGDTSGHDADDILAELEEELRREAEADDDDDPPAHR